MAFGYEVAGIGSRFIGALVDVLLLGLLLVLVNVLLLVALNLTGDSASVLFGGLDDGITWQGGLALAVYALVNFGLLWGYFSLFELLWNGQTPGKRAAGTRVIRTDGNAAGLLEIAIRNLVRVIDFLPAWYALGLIVMFFNRQSRRLGDFAAGTLVVKARHDMTLANLLPPAAAVEPGGAAGGSPLSLLPGWRSLTPTDVDLVQATLQRARQRTVDPALLTRLAAVIAAKLGCPPPEDARGFLEEVAAEHARRRGR